MPAIVSAVISTTLTARLRESASMRGSHGAQTPKVIVLVWAFLLAANLVALAMGYSPGSKFLSRGEYHVIGDW